MAVNSQIRNKVAAGERVSRNLYLQAAGGTLDRVFLTHRHGINEDIEEASVDAEGWATVWNITHPYPRVLSAGKLEVVSDNAQDHETGDGAQMLILIGCDGNGDPIMEVVIPSGTTPVQTQQDFFWFSFAHVVRAGTLYGGALGEITITHTGTIEVGDLPTVGKIVPKYNRTMNCISIIPNEYSGYILGSDIGTATPNRGGIFAFRVSARTGVRQVISPTYVAGGGPYEQIAPAPERIHYPSLVEMVVDPTLPNTYVFGGMTLLAVHDDYDFSIPEGLLKWTPSQITAWFQENPNVENSLAGFSQ